MEALEEMMRWSEKVGGRRGGATSNRGGGARGAGVDLFIVS